MQDMRDSDTVWCGNCDYVMPAEEIEDFIMINDCNEDCPVCGSLLDYVVSDPS